LVKTSTFLPSDRCASTRREVARLRIHESDELGEVEILNAFKIEKNALRALQLPRR
jgi:hypothetical protein